jgi:hypothetical protein
LDDLALAPPEPIESSIPRFKLARRTLRLKSLLFKRFFVHPDESNELPKGVSGPLSRSFSCARTFEEGCLQPIASRIRERIYRIKELDEVLRKMGILVHALEIRVDNN